MPGSRIAWFAMGIAAGGVAVRLADYVGGRREWLANASFSLGSMRATASFNSSPVRGDASRLPLS